MSESEKDKLKNYLKRNRYRITNQGNRRLQKSLNAIIDLAGESEELEELTERVGTLETTVSAHTSNLNLLANSFLDCMAPDTFSGDKSYEVGDLVRKRDTEANTFLLYKCTTAHPAGVWDDSHFTSTNLSAEISALIKAQSSQS